MGDRRPDDHGSGPTPKRSGLPARTLPESQREAVVELLSAAFTIGDLTTEEFEQRVSRAYQVQTADQLAELTEDLAPSTALEPASPSGAMARAAPRVSVVLGSVDRSEVGPVPKQLVLRSVLASIELDFRRAEFEPGVTEIVVNAFLANVELEFPDDVEVDCQVSNIVGNLSIEGGHKHKDDRPEPTSRVRVVGRAILSNVEIDGGASLRRR